MFKIFDKDKKPENIKDVSVQLEKLEQKLENALKKIEELERKSKFSVQKVEMTRYNPFSGVGGDQSFSIVLLDENNNGIIVTSLFTQEGNRVYGKQIENGVSKYTLSAEEKKVITKAINND